jgi:hypothetical protein
MAISKRFRGAVRSLKRSVRARFLTSSTDKIFLETIDRWLKGGNEVLVLIRHPNAAGNRSFEFFSSPAALVGRLRHLERRTSVTVFKRPQLPLRGIVDDKFIESCMRAIPEGSEFLVTETVQRKAGKMSWFHNDAGVTHAELYEALDDSRGTPVAVGLHPDWLAKNPDVVTAYVPDEDGVVRPAAY